MSEDVDEDRVGETSGAEVPISNQFSLLNDSDNIDVNNSDQNRMNKRRNSEKNSRNVKGRNEDDTQENNNADSLDGNQNENNTDSAEDVQNQNNSDADTTSVNGVQNQNIIAEIAEVREENGGMESNTVVPESNECTGLQEGNNSIEVSNTLIIMDLVEEKKNLIKDRATILNLLRIIPFGPKYSGKPRFNYTKFQLVLVINEVRDIPELLQINKLTNEVGDWSVKFHRGVRNPGLHYGVMKGIPPEVSLDRVKAEFVRNSIDVQDIIRIKNRQGPTHCLKIEFTGEIPEEIEYAGEPKTIYRFNPPSWTLICNNCAKGGHKADYCRSPPKCPICSENHARKDCQKYTVQCANCNQQHTARYGKCPYFQMEKDIMKIRTTENVPRHTAKNIWKIKEEERKRAIENDRLRYLQQNHENLIPVLQTK
ncbi:unnamed protein product, partial [Meganyctiphanes norvegica]